MANLKYFTPILTWLSVVADETIDPDADPQIKGIYGGVTVTPTIAGGDARAVRVEDLSPTAALLAIAPFEARLDDGQLMLRADSDKPVTSYANLAAFPPVGDTTQLYRAQDTNLYYEWNGSAYFLSVDYARLRLLANCPVLELPDGITIWYEFRFHHITYNGKDQDLPTITVAAPFIPEAHDDLTDGEITLNLATAEWIQQSTPPVGNEIFIRHVPDDVTLVGSTLQFYAQAEPLGDPLTLPGGGGTVNAVVPGNNIDVDNTDPANPIVSVETLTSADISNFNTAVNALIAAVIDGAPGALDTLNELAAALGDDPNFATTMTNALAGKQPLNASLTGIAATAIPTGSRVLFTTDQGATWQTFATASYGRSLVLAADAAAAQTLLSLVPGTNVQPYDADLAAIAALADPNADRILFWDDSAGAFAYLTLGTNLSITGTTINAAGGGGGGVVNAVVAGANIDVDATDPANPIVSVETLTIADISDVTASAAELNTLDGITASTAELNHVDGVTSAIQGQLDGKQASDSDLTAIAGLSPTNDDIIQRKSGAWTNRTPAQLKTDLALVKGDVGLGNVDNTSNATERAATRTLTNARITKRALQSSNDTTFDIDTDLYDYAEDTGLTGGVTVTWSGTPTLGQTLWVRLQGTASRAITWDTDFEASGTVPLPTTTSGTAALDVGFVWNSATSKLRCVAVA